MGLKHENYKYQHLTRSCTYAALANLVQSYGIDVEDYDILKEIHIPYVFRYTQNYHAYIAGSMLQDLRWINYFLNQYGLTFITQQLSKDSIIDFLNQTKKEWIVSLKQKDVRHAILYIGKENNKYVFLNPHLKYTRSNDYFYFNESEVLDRIECSMPAGSIQKIDNKILLNNKSELNKSIKDLKMFKKDILQFCSQKQTYDSIIEFRNRVCVALFYDTYSMMNLIEEDTIASKIELLNQSFNKAIRSNKEVLLLDFIDYDFVEKLVDELIDLTINKINEL